MSNQIDIQNAIAMLSAEGYEIKTPPPKKEWEIVEFTTKRGAKIIKQRDELSWVDWGLTSMEGLTITKVKRLSDGEMFEVGDNLSDGRITVIEIHDGNIGLGVDQNACYVDLMKAKKLSVQPKKERIEVFVGNSMYSEGQLREAERQAFIAARSTNPWVGMRYDNFEDYLNSKK